MKNLRKNMFFGFILYNTCIIIKVSSIVNLRFAGSSTTRHTAIFFNFDYFFIFFHPMTQWVTCVSSIRRSGLRVSLKTTAIFFNFDYFFIFFHPMTQWVTCVSSIGRSGLRVSLKTTAILFFPRLSCVHFHM